MCNPSRQSPVEGSNSHCCKWFSPRNQLNAHRPQVAVRVQTSRRRRACFDGLLVEDCWQRPTFVEPVGGLYTRPLYTTEQTWPRAIRHHGAHDNEPSNVRRGQSGVGSAVGAMDRDRVEAQPRETGARYEGCNRDRDRVCHLVGQAPRARVKTSSDSSHSSLAGDRPHAFDGVVHDRGQFDTPAPVEFASEGSDRHAIAHFHGALHHRSRWTIAARRG